MERCVCVIFFYLSTFIEIASMTLFYPRRNKTRCVIMLVTFGRRRIINKALIKFVAIAS